MKDSDKSSGGNGAAQRKELPFVFKNKGQIKPNNARKPTSFQGGAGSMAVAANNRTAAATEAAASDERREAALAESQAHLVPMAPGTELTSINRNSDAAANGPCFSASINKDSFVDAVVSRFLRI